MEARYTTNKGLLPEMLSAEMREAFERAEEFLDIDTNAVALVVDQQMQDGSRQQQMQDIIRYVAPEQIVPMLEALRRAGNIRGQAVTAAPATVM